MRSTHRSPRRAAGKTTPRAAGLARTSAQARLDALRRQKDSLAGRIARKQKRLESFDRACHELAHELLPRLTPLMERAQALGAEIHESFRTILTTRKLGKRSHRAIREVYLTLMETGLISPSPLEPEPAGSDDAWGAGFAAQDGEQGEPDTPPRHDERHPPAQEKPVAAGRARGSARSIFLALATRFHPDRIRDADEQARHTEIMKELTRAYREGDMARLLELERQLDAGRAGEAGAGPSAEEQCTALEAQIRALREQLRALDEHLVALRCSPLGSMLDEYRRLKKLVPDPAGVFVDDLQEELDTLEEIAEFVRQFRDGKMTIKAFLRGPEGGSFEPGPDLIEIDGELFEPADDEDLVEAMSQLLRRR